MAECFAPIKTTICTAFLPALLGGTTPNTIPPDLRVLLSLPIKPAGVGVPNPTNSADDNHTTSSMCTAVLTNPLLDGIPLTITDYQKAIRDGRSVDQASKRANATANLLSLTAPMTPFAACQTTHNTKTGAWISIQPTLINGLSLSKDKWRNAIRRRYGLELLELPKCYNNCGAESTIEHALACKKDGLVAGQHNEVKAEPGGISIQTLRSNQVCDKLKIITYRDTLDT